MAAPLPLGPIAIGVALLLWLRSRSEEAPPLAPFDPAQTGRALDALCNAGASMPNDARAVARLVLADAYPSVSWPPRLGASASHKAVWADGMAWATELVNAAGAMPLCEYIDGGDGPIPELGTFVPVPTPPPLPELEFVPPPPPQTAEMLPPISPDPMPGRRYAIKYGDTLLGVAGRAYQVPAGPSRLDGAVRINEGQLPGVDVRFSMPGTTAYQQSVGNLASAFPDGVISFGTPHQIIYIP